MKAPSFQMAHRCVFDPLDPVAFWETLYGRHWLCRALWGRGRHSFGSQQADKDKITVNVSQFLCLLANEDVL